VLPNLAKVVFCNLYCVAVYQVNLLKDGKDIPPELMSQSEQPTSPVNPSGTLFGPDEAALRDKVNHV